MCLAVPARIESIDGTTAFCRLEGLTKAVDLTLVPQARPGDWIIVHVGFALQKIDETKAQETLALLERLKRQAAREKCEEQDISDLPKDVESPSSRREGG